MKGNPSLGNNARRLPDFCHALILENVNINGQCNLTCSLLAKNTQKILQGSHWLNHVTLVVTVESWKNKPSPWTNNICSVNDIFRFKSNVDGFAKQKKSGKIFWKWFCSVCLQFSGLFCWLNCKDILVIFYICSEEGLTLETSAF